MFEQAAEEKAKQLAEKIFRAQLIERLHKLSYNQIELSYQAASIAAKYRSRTIARKVQQVRSTSQGNPDSAKFILIAEIIRINPEYAEREYLNVGANSFSFYTRRTS